MIAKMFKQAFNRLTGKRERIEIDYSSRESVTEGFRKAGYTFEPKFHKGYEQQVHDLRTSKEKTTFINSTPEHSSFILSEMLKVEDADKFQLYDLNLSGDLLELNENNTLYNALDKFLRNGNEVEIIIPSNAPKKQSVIEKLKKLSAYKLSIFELNTDSIIQRQDLFDIPYFSVSGRSAFRQQKQKENRAAICSFNNVEKTKSLISIFSELRDSYSKPLILS